MPVIGGPGGGGGAFGGGGAGAAPAGGGGGSGTKPPRPRALLMRTAITLRPATSTPAGIAYWRTALVLFVVAPTREPLMYVTSVSSTVPSLMYAGLPAAAAGKSMTLRNQITPMCSPSAVSLQILGAWMFVQPVSSMAGADQLAPG